MKTDKKEALIPEQKEGASTDTSAVFTAGDEAEAISFFDMVKQRLLNVNEWEKVAGIASADFRLCDANGNEAERFVKKGDHFRIDIPGPGSVTGDGYDWVKVEDVITEETDSGEIVSIRVRPATNPQNDHEDVAHFFSDAATSSFIAERNGLKITAGVYGRNEKPNSNTEKVIDKARNAVVAATAITAFSKIQWKSLVEGLIKE